MHLLYVIRDPYPNERPDVLTLFGRRLPELGITSDIVAVRRGHLAANRDPWPGGRELVRDRSKRLLGRMVRACIHDLNALRRHRNYDLVVVRDKIFAAALALLIARRGRVVYWMSYPFPEQDLLQARNRDMPIAQALAHSARGLISKALLYRFVVPRARHVFVQSDRMREAVTGLTGRSDGLTTVPMGVADELLPDARRVVRTEPVDGTFELLYLGSLDGARRIDFLFDVLARLVSRWGDKSWRLCLVGGTLESGEVARLRRRMGEMGLANLVTMTGFLPLRDAWRRAESSHIGLSAIPRSDLFDVSSPTKAVEYIALGLPIVATDIPDQRYLIERSGAGRCSPMEIDAFCSEIEAVRRDYGVYAAKAADALDWIREERGYRAIARRVAAALMSSTGTSLAVG